MALADQRTGGPLPTVCASLEPMKAVLPLTVLALAACAAPLPEATTELVSISERPPPPLPLGPGDVLQVVVHGRPEFSFGVGLRITPAGSVVLPIAGPVNVAGLSVEKAGEAIEAALTEYIREPTVGITVQEHGAHRFHVLGRVARPGTYVMDRAVTALDALATAQGLREGANRESVAILRRHGTDQVEVHFFDASRPDSDGLVYLLPGDLVFVARSGSGVFRDEVLPILQGIGFTTNQIAAVAVASGEF